MARMGAQPDPRTPETSVPAGYEEWLADVSARVRATQYTIMRGANAETIRLYWSIGQDIADRGRRLGWGSTVIERLSSDLQREFPGREGFSVTNLNYMRALVTAWGPPGLMPPQVVEELPWGHVRALLDGLDDVDDRNWYAYEAAAQGWSCDMLRFQIDASLRRLGTAPSNVTDTLPPPDSDLARQITTDPYVFEVASPFVSPRPCEMRPDPRAQT